MGRGADPSGLIKIGADAGLLEVARRIAATL